MLRFGGQCLADFVRDIEPQKVRYKIEGCDELREKIYLPKGVAVREISVNCVRGSLDHSLLFALNIPGDDIITDLDFLHQVYGEAYERSDTGVSFSEGVDEFGDWPLECANGVWASRSAIVFSPQTDQKFLGDFSYPRIRLQYTSMGIGGERVELNVGAAFEDIVEDMRQALGLDKYLIKITGGDYIKLREKISKFIPERRVKGWIELPVDEGALEKIQEIIGVLKPDTTRFATKDEGFCGKAPEKAHISGYFRSVDSTPEGVHEILKTGFEMIDSLDLESDSLQAKDLFSQGLLRRKFEGLLDYAHGEDTPDAYAIKRIEELLKRYDPEGKAMAGMGMRIDPASVFLKKDAYALTEWYLRVLDNAIKPRAKKPLRVYYQARAMEPGDFPDHGLLHRMTIEDRTKQISQDLLWVKRKGDEQVVWIGVDIEDPKLLGVQQRILDRVGVSFLS